MEGVAVETQSEDKTAAGDLEGEEGGDGDLSEEVLAQIDQLLARAQSGNDGDFD